MNLMTILYVSIQATLSEPGEMVESKKQFRAWCADLTPDEGLTD